jgi:outer membrane protein
MNVFGLAMFALAGLGACASKPAREPDVYPSPPAADAREKAPRPPDGPLAFDQAVQLALSNYPAIRAAQARQEAAGEGIDLARTAYLPRLDLLWQSVRATRNNISGQFLPQPVVPGISGPVVDKSWDHAWGSMAGALLSWEPFDFGARGSQVDLAHAFERQARADTEVTRLDVALAAADAFILLVAAQETERAARANVERWDVFSTAVKTLVDQELRPGVDHSRAAAELASARTQLIQARQAVEVGRATLAEGLGFKEAEIEIDPAPLLGKPASADLPPAELQSHPLLRRQDAAVEAARARKEAVENAYGPRVNLQLSLSDRGSGFGAAGEPLDPEDGIYPDRYNWAAGVSVYFPLMDYFGVQSRARLEEATARSERHRTDQILLQLTLQDRRVRAAYDAARKISENTPVQLKAAQEATTRARARYDAGLGTLTEVAEAQRLLAQAEIDDALARLGIWRALAGAARVQGDVRPLLDRVGRARRDK